LPEQPLMLLNKAVEGTLSKKLYKAANLKRTG
jgi:hypothetical protein